MAEILGGIGTSHVPTIGGAYDRNKQNDPDWAPLFRGYEPVKQWLAEKTPDVLVFFYNDHATTFFFDHYPTFALGVSAEYPIADEGLGPRAVPPLKGHAGLARHMADALVNDEFDISVFQDLPIDHGVHSPLTMFWPPSPDWPGKIVPIEINVLQHPIPTPARCWKLGQAVRRAVLSYPEDLKVVIVGTGGLSHQMNGERAGFNNEKWDRKFLDLIARDPRKLVAMRHADYIRLGGTEGAEEIMWLAMRGALSPRAKKIHQSYYLPMTTAMAVALFEEPDAKPAPRKARSARKTRRNGARASADPRKPNTNTMVDLAKAMTDDEVRAAAEYFSAIKYTPWIRVVETERVPKTKISGNLFLPIEQEKTEPIAGRIIEVDTPGLTCIHPAAFTYRRARRPLWGSGVE